MTLLRLALFLSFELSSSVGVDTSSAVNRMIGMSVGCWKRKSSRFPLMSKFAKSSTSGACVVIRNTWDKRNKARTVLTFGGGVLELVEAEAVLVLCKIENQFSLINAIRT